MKKSKHKLALVATTTLTIGAVLSGCSYQKTDNAITTQGKSQASNIINVGIDVDAQNLDPRLSTDTTSVRVDDLVYDGLVRLDPNLNPQPDLATSWDNPNPTTWVFHLRTGVTFQDGAPFTADDVKYTYDSILDPNFKAPNAGLYAPIKEVKVIDSHTVELDLKAPYAPLFSYLGIGIVPKSIGEKNDSSLSTHPIGTGPYEFVSWTKKNKIVLQANPKYWSSSSSIKEIDINIIPDNTARAAALESGGVDLVESPLSPQDVARIKKNNDFIVQQTNGFATTYLNFNQKNPVLSDPKVRQAIAHLVDKQTISRQIYQSMDTPGISSLIPASFAYSDNIPVYKNDPALAKTILEQDGWKLGSDGVYEKNGKKLNVTLSTHSEDPNRVQTIQLLQNTFAKAGIQTNVSITEWPTFISNMMHGKYDIGLLGLGNITDPDRSTYTYFHTGGTNNWGGYSNPQVDKLLDEGRSTLDKSKRAAIYQQLATLENQDVYHDVVLYQGYVVLYTKKLIGFTMNPSGSLYGLVSATLK